MPTLFEALLKPYRRRWLDPAAGYKPLDFGSGAITGSVNQDGRITAVSTYDPQHGYVTLTSAPPFPENARYDAEQVRAYRRGLVALEGFGLEFRASVVSRSAYLIEDAIPMIRLTLADGVVADCVTFVPEDSARDVIQIWAFSEAGQHARLSGQMWLQRAAYTQLTEGGPVAMPPVSTTQVFDHTGVTPVGIMNEAVNWRVHFTSGTRLKDNVDGSVSFDKALLQVDESEWIYPQTIREGMHLPGVGLASSDETVPPIRTAFFHFHFDYRAGGDVQVSAEHTDIKLTLKEAQTALVNLLDIWRERWHAWRYKHERQVITDLPLRRAVVYGLNCCVPVDHEAVCILTDHMLLPLSWNRDSYYVARGLLNWRRDMQEIIRRHLIWLFERAERVNGGWGRSYLANGTVKDRGFQLDQQLFPVIELTEYTLETQDRVTYQRLRSRVADVLDMLDLHRDSETGLYSTEETPADDPIAFPYHLSSHILMWRMLDLLVRLEGEHFDKRPIGKMRDQIREAVNTYFVTNYADSALYAYATDGMGHYHLYHDANDVPVVFAPFWGMLASDDSVWSQTIDFAFSAANKGGFHGGHLGSVHTPAAWPLGDIQEIVAAAAVGDTQRAKSARQHLAQAACWDGALPEAYDPDTYQVVSRHWFAWPNAMLACLDIEQHPASEPTVIDETPSRLKSPQLAQRRRTSPMNIGFISTRLAGVDGVSLETAKMVQVLEEMGHQCFYIAGEFDSTAKPGWLVPSMHFYDPVAHSIHDEVFRNPNPSPKTFRRIYSIADNIRNELMAFIEEYDIDLIVPQNASTIPMNISLGVAIAETIKRTRIKTICHHHDFYWERDRFINNGIQDILNEAFPPALESIRHLTINQVMQRRLKAFRGIEAINLPNVFDFDSPPEPPDAYAMTFREELGISADDLIVLQPTRLIRRKAIEKAIELVRKLDDPRLILIITGYEGDEPGNYGSWLMEEAERSGIRYKFIGEYVGADRGERDGHRVYNLWDVYPHAHIVTYPSVYEGFGNALIETCYFRKPFVVHRYAAYLSDIKPTGIKAVEFYHDIDQDVLDQTRRIIDDPAYRDEMIEHNYRVCLDHFSFQVLRNVMKQVLSTFNANKQFVTM